MSNLRDAGETAQTMAYMYKTGRIEEARRIAEQKFGTMGPLLLEVLAARGYTPDEIARKMEIVAGNIKERAEKFENNERLQKEKASKEAEEEAARLANIEAKLKADAAEKQKQLEGFFTDLHDLKSKRTKLQEENKKLHQKKKEEEEKLEKLRKEKEDLEKQEEQTKRRKKDRKKMRKREKDPQRKRQLDIEEMQDDRILADIKERRSRLEKLHKQQKKVVEQAQKAVNENQIQMAKVDKQIEKTQQNIDKTVREIETTQQKENTRQQEQQNQNAVAPQIITQDRSR